MSSNITLVPSSTLTSSFNHNEIMKYDQLFNDWIKSNQQNPFDKSNNNSNDSIVIKLFEILKELMSKYKKEGDANHQPPELLKNIFVIIFFSLIFIISLIGNSLVCLVIFSKRRMRLKRTNLLIANLTISDLLMTITSIPWNVINNLTNNWPFGLFLCKLLPFLQATSIYVSSFTMTIIALNRYQSFIYKRSRNPSNRLPKIPFIISTILILSILFSISYGINNDIVQASSSRIKCHVKYYQIHNHMFTFLTQFIIPLGVTALVYLLIGFHIWKHYQFNGIQSGSAEQINRFTKSKRRTIKICVLVVIMFAVSWLPLSLFISFNNSLKNFYSSTFWICYWFAMSSVCWNPIIYFSLDRQYKNAAKELINKIRCYRRDSSIEETLQ